MNYSLGMTMREAMRLMQTGDLHAATAAIQRGLVGAEDRPTFHPENAGGAAEKPWIDAGSAVAAACHVARMHAVARRFCAGDPHEPARRGGGLLRRIPCSVST